MLKVVSFVNILLTGLVTGVVFGVWRGYDPTLLSYASFVEVHQGAVRGLNVLIPLLGGIGILTTVVHAYLRRGHRATMWTLIIAALCFVAAALVTRFGNQPFNAVVMTWNTTFVTPDWQTLRADWWSFHKIRLTFSLIGFCLVIAASLNAFPTRTNTSRV